MAVLESDSIHFFVIHKNIMLLHCMDQAAL